MNKKFLSSSYSLFHICLLSIVISCSESESAIEAGSIKLLSEREQTALSESILAEPIEIVALDENGNAFAGLDVHFAITEGSVSSIKTTTNQEGKASVTWTLGKTVGVQSLHITAYKSDGKTLLSGAPITVSVNSKLEANTLIDVEGNFYDIVSIGNQVWMAENLRTTKYPNGAPITHISADHTWGDLSDNGTDDAYCIYKSTTYTREDVLYTWAAAMGDNVENSSSYPNTNQGVCPDNWHLPSEMEWKELINYLDGPEVAGGKMKTIGTDYWISPNTGATNESGFSAFPWGCRTSLGSFIAEKQDGFWWSSSKVSETNAWNIVLSYHHVDVLYDNTFMSSGFSVRCVKD